jgi:serine/threonine-protein phosphatase CPPED1
MKQLKLFFTAATFFIFIFTASSQEKRNTDPYFIIQVTDPQFGMNDGDKGFAYETALYEKAVNAINSLKPDFVVITGDLVNNRGNREQVAEFKRISSQINKEIPVWYLPGNHDIGQTPEQKDIDMFISDYGHDRFAFQHKGSTFLGLNSQLIKTDNPEAEEIQFNWLKGVLEKAPLTGHIIVFSHYPLFIKLAIEPETYSNIAYAKRKKYLSLLSEYHADAVFAGHLHNNSRGSWDDIEMITTSAVGKPLADAPSGIRIIKIYPDRIVSAYYGLDEIPEIITFAPLN